MAEIKDSIYIGEPIQKNTDYGFKRRKKSHFLTNLHKYRGYLLMLLPAILFFIVFSYIPMAGIIIAFKDYSYSGGVFGSPWIGFQNFNYILSSGDLLTIIRNTVGYNLAFIIVNNGLEIAFAIMMVSIGSKWFKRISQTAILLPYFISWVVVGGLAYNLFNSNYGFINTFVKMLGKSPINFYINPSLWIGIIIIACAWKSVGYGMIIYMAAIIGIDPTIYEAAEIDGASSFQRTFRITIPLLIPTLIILVLLSLGNIFRGDFSMYYQLVGNNSMLWPTTDVIDTFVTRSLIQNSDIGMSAAAGFCQSIFGFVTVVVANLCIRRYDKEYSLF
jgi:ABC-type polysaccharide transport system, permease component